MQFAHNFNEISKTGPCNFRKKISLNSINIFIKKFHPTSPDEICQKPAFSTENK